MYAFKKTFTAVVGVMLVVLGVSAPYYWSKLLMCFVRRDLALSPASRSHDLWRGTPVPITMDFYFFNWTNPGELLNGTKPAFTEMGPYRFMEEHEKVNVTWNANGTVTFQMIRRWRFDERGSRGSLDDQVTTLNVVSMTAAHTVRHWTYLLQASLSLTLTATKQKLFVTKPVRQLLFEGYSDQLLDIARTLPQFHNVEVPFDRFGWFYKMNDTTLMDGVTTMDTGADDILRIGQVRAWNYRSRTKYYSGACAEVRGSAGELFTPGVERRSLTVFSANLCRSVRFDYTNDQQVRGLAGRRYAGGAAMVDNGTLLPDNRCFCDGDCLPSGVINITACRYGAPGFASFPHFHLADPAYRRAVGGMRPDPDRHTFYIVLEPTTGIPLDVGARLQVNILLHPVESISLYSKVPEVMMPMMWFDQRGTLTPALAEDMRRLLLLFSVEVYVAVVLVVLGSLLLARLAFTARRSPATNTLHLVTQLEEMRALKSGRVEKQSRL